MALQLQADGIGQRFHKHWIFKNVHFSLASGDRLLITGSNGSGKSTLFRILAGQLTPSKGSMRYLRNDQPIDPGTWFKLISWSGPYMDLYPELTLQEAFKLHFSFRKSLLPLPEVLHKLDLSAHAHKELRHFSSGMLHRAKVGLALFSHSEVLLLDEASTNMDAQYGQLVWDLAREFQQDRILVWASNQSTEFDWFEMRLNLK